MQELFKCWFLVECQTEKWSFTDFLRGVKKAYSWKNLKTFRKSRILFKERLAYSSINFFEFCTLLGKKSIKLKKNIELEWFFDSLRYFESNTEENSKEERFRILLKYQKRGIISPFFSLISGAVNKLSNSLGVTDEEIEIFLDFLLNSLENLIRRAFVLELNIQKIRGNLLGDTDLEKFENFIKNFENRDECFKFILKYPVLFRAVVKKINSWTDSTSEFLERLKSDRKLIENQFNIVSDSKIISIIESGDSHNNGRSVFIVKFACGNSLVYKPRSTSLELKFQLYLNFFNSNVPNLNLKTIIVADQGNYGWVEFVIYRNQKNEEESVNYHFKLGFLTSLVYSLGGVDIFFENLISSGADPVIIDLETMFHTPIETYSKQSPVEAYQKFLNESVSGIGILPLPHIGFTESEIFDISVMGSKVNAKAPYTVNSFENFGLANMRIIEIPGWINETKSNTEDSISFKSKATHYYKGLKIGLEFILENKQIIYSDEGIIYRLFNNSIRRLIVRDTKVYGSLQQDETHPDLLRNQWDREIHLDNLWTDIIERPSLVYFIKSELNQMKLGDIPYFSGFLSSLKVNGGDGSIIDLSGVISESALEKILNKKKSFNRDTMNDQLFIASAILGIENLEEITQPRFDKNKSSLENSMIIAKFLISKTKYVGGNLWLGTTINPVPKASNSDLVRVVPSDPFLYEGILGVAMYLYDLWSVTKDLECLNTSVLLFDSVFKEIEEKDFFSTSGFVGLASVVYSINRCMEREIIPLKKYENNLSVLIGRICDKIRLENKLDFLLGISGTATALIPYTERTRNKKGHAILKDSQDRLRQSAKKLLNSTELIEGMDFLRGFSHGISGLAYALYKLGEYFKEETDHDLIVDMLLKESKATKESDWTDSHRLNGNSLVGWCHGSAGIALALASMPKIYSKNSEVRAYYNRAILNTSEYGNFHSKCLCHGTIGNYLIMDFCKKDSEGYRDNFFSIKNDLLENGFSSLNSAQSMSIGLMTGFAGAGYFLLSSEEKSINYDFINLS